jgi:hypothetical protein
MKHLLATTILLSALFACAQNNSNKDVYPKNVGDIAFDPDVDDPNFKPCDEKQVFQYYNFGKGLQYKGEKPELVAHFKKFKEINSKGATGFITIRFIVNCEGKTGRFRIQEMSNDYVVKSFGKEITDQLLSLTKSLDGWIAATNKERNFDYYQYLTFKIEDGRLIEIMP